MVNSEVAQTNGTPAVTSSTNKESSAPVAASPPSATASPRHCAPKMNTQDRLFGNTPEPPKKATKNNPTFKSNVFAPQLQSPAKTSKKQIPVIERNPITGEVKIPPRVTV